MREYLVQLREQRNESQQNVADNLGISRQYYSMIENGERQKDMDITLLYKLSAVFDVPLEQLLKMERDLEREKENPA